MQTIIEAKNLSICYEKSQPIIKNASFSINAKDFVFITGKSGSGKSTLIRSFYGAMPCAGGSLMVCLKELNNISSSSLAKLRQKLGLIFQDFKLIDEWSIEKNVMLPLLIKGYSKNISRKQAQKMLDYENIILPIDMDYLNIKNLASEARLKLDKVHPTSIGQAMRISGVNPADISILMIELRKRH